MQSEATSLRKANGSADRKVLVVDVRALGLDGDPIGRAGPWDPNGLNVTDNEKQSNLGPEAAPRLEKLLSEDPVLTHQQRDKIKIAFAEGYLAGSHPDNVRGNKASKYLKFVQQLLTIVLFLAIFVSLMASVSGTVFSPICPVPIYVPTAGAQAFPMDGIGRLGHDPPRGPSADWWVLTTADAAGTNGLTCLPKHRGARDSKFLVTHPMTDHCESCLTSTTAAERANHLRHRAPHSPSYHPLKLNNQ
ncbi:hypothetical protein evm_001664 [Chilo suppressalis]|nr:hypothetical protein evm_001664 [Chilo suppressalis]